ncbi:MAG TPA: hypothetical protein VIL25_07425 [Vicinamibacterales bacterium]
MLRAARSVLLVTALVLSAILSMLPVLGASPRQDATVRGEVVDVFCYRSDPGHRGDVHVDCALSCARKGAVLGILTGTGEVYVITGEFTTEANRRLLPFVGRTVVATGEAGEANGTRTIRVTSIAPAEQADQSST